ncbi:hypothetical protein D3C80_1669010 [compost metagenome]
MHDQRMEHPLAFAHVQRQGTLGAGGLLGKDDHLAAMLVATPGNLVGDVVDFEQRRTALGFGDEGTDPLHAHQQPFGRELTQGAVDGHAAEAQLADQLAL